MSYMLMPQEWERVVLDGKPTARVTCPKCGNSYLLDHDIAEDGAITPSLDCPTDGCSFHEFASLVGWGNCWPTQERPACK